MDWVYNCLSSSRPVSQDDDWFLFWMDIIGLVRSCYNFEKGHWIHLPFSGGFMEQADVNPYLWHAVNYIIKKEKETIH